MPLPIEEIKRLIKEDLPDASIEIKDLMGDNNHYSATIKSKIFAGKRRYYDNETIEIIKKIKFLLKDKGMTINGVKKQLIKDDSDLDVSDNISINTKNILKSKINKISKLVKNLKR